MSFDPEVPIDVETYCKLSAEYLIGTWETLGGEHHNPEDLKKVLLKFFNSPFDDLMKQIMDLKVYRQEDK